MAYTLDAGPNVLVLTRNLDYMKVLFLFQHIFQIDNLSEVESPTEDEELYTFVGENNLNLLEKCKKHKIESIIQTSIGTGPTYIQSVEE